MESTLEDFEALSATSNFRWFLDWNSYFCLHFPRLHSFLGAAWPSLAGSCGVARLRGSVRRRSRERATLPPALSLRRVEDPSRADTPRNSNPWAQHNPTAKAPSKQPVSGPIPPAPHGMAEGIATFASH